MIESYVGVKGHLSGKGRVEGTVFVFQNPPDSAGNEHAGSARALNPRGGTLAGRVGDGATSVSRRAQTSGGGRLRGELRVDRCLGNSHTDVPGARRHGVPLEDLHRPRVAAIAALFELRSGAQEGPDR